MLALRQKEVVETEKLQETIEVDVDMIHENEGYCPENILIWGASCPGLDRYDAGECGKKSLQY
jgi:hypothetical protein